MAEHDSAVIGGGGMAERDSVVLGGGGMAVPDSAITGGGGMAGVIQAPLEAAGLTGTGPGAGTSGFWPAASAAATADRAALAADSISLCCVPHPGFRNCRER
jgi:hypothetical protein